MPQAEYVSRSSPIGSAYWNLPPTKVGVKLMFPFVSLRLDVCSRIQSMTFVFTGCTYQLGRWNHHSGSTISDLTAAVRARMRLCLLMEANQAWIQILAAVIRQNFKPEVAGESNITCTSWCKNRDINGRSLVNEYLRLNCVESLQIYGILSSPHRDHGTFNHRQQPSASSFLFFYP